MARTGNVVLSGNIEEKYVDVVRTNYFKNVAVKIKDDIEPEKRYTIHPLLDAGVTYDENVKASKYDAGLVRGLINCSVYLINSYLWTILLSG